MYVKCITLIHVVGQGVDGDHLYSQDSSHSSGTTQLHDVTTQSLVSQTSWASSAADSIHDDDQPQENHRRFVLESDHLALKNNGEYVDIYNMCLCYSLMEGIICVLSILLLHLLSLWLLL